MDYEVRFRDLNVLLQMKERQLQFGELLLGHRDT